MHANLRDIMISHVNEKREVQTNELHQQGVAGLASLFAADFGCSDLDAFSRCIAFER